MVPAAVTVERWQTLSKVHDYGGGLCLFSASGGGRRTAAAADSGGGRRTADGGGRERMMLGVGWHVNIWHHKRKIWLGLLPVAPRYAPIRSDAPKWRLAQL